MSKHPLAPVVMFFTAAVLLISAFWLIEKPEPRQLEGFALYLLNGARLPAPPESVPAPSIRSDLGVWPSVQVTGGVGINHCFGCGANTQFVVQFFVKNVSGNELVFDSVDVDWRVTGGTSLLSTKIEPYFTGVQPWKLPPGEQTAFVSASENYISQNSLVAQRASLIFEISLIRGNDRIGSAYQAAIPITEVLPATTIDVQADYSRLDRNLRVLTFFSTPSQP